MIAAGDLSKFLVVLALGAAACGGGGGGGGGPPGAVSFAQDIQPIFNDQCTSCHNSTSLRGGLDLTAPGSWGRLVNIATSPTCSAAVPNVPRVKSSDTAGSMLWRKTKPVDQSATGRCGDPMPNIMSASSPGLGVSSPSQFAKIEAWIQQGALNN